MNDPVRTFIAMDVSLPTVLRAMVRQFGEMGRAVKAVDAENVHLTLKFLGDTPTEQVAEVDNIVQSVAGDFEPLELELVGIGAFPHWGRPSVVWAGVKPEDSLREMAERLESALKPLGFAPEKRAYHPHLTLARIKARPPAELKTLALEHETESFGRQTVESVIFYQSELQSTGPVYTPLSTATLQGGE